MRTGAVMSVVTSIEEQYETLVATQRENMGLEIAIASVRSQSEMADADLQVVVRRMRAEIDSIRARDKGEA